MNTSPDFLLVFQGILAALEAAKIPYMVVGSVASIMYGEPRLTRDLDLVVSLKASEAGVLQSLFPAPRFYLPPAEILTQEIAQRGYFNLLDIPSGLKVDFVICKLSDHATTEFQRRQRLEFVPGFAAWVAAPEDVIVKKLVFFLEGRSSKHLDDIRGILANTAVDHAYLELWVAKLNLLDAWAAL